MNGRELTLALRLILLSSSVLASCRKICAGGATEPPPTGQGLVVGATKTGENGLRACLALGPPFSQVVESMIAFRHPLRARRMPSVNRHLKLVANDMPRSASSVPFKGSHPLSVDSDSSYTALNRLRALSHSN